MVCDWSPEPPRDEDDRMSMPSENIAVESDESGDEEMFGTAPPGYELLPQVSLTGLDSEDENNSDVEAAGPSGSVIDPVQNSFTSNTLDRRPSEVEEVDHLYSAPDLRPDLTVDCEEVKAAMSGFSLPPSAIPAWALNIPESEWADTLSQQIRRIQGNQPHSNSGT